ncbi:hypothetical protein [Paenibacillus albiflavus]|uniref:hypothetical protein n=1 Tax=Paenibacillus albiflavus TaxID=2545760 RepID=UPI00140455A1|nr:hypothetical protein [Paenibacillus albiflavus]
MGHYKVARLDESVVQEIKQFENKLKAETGREVALVAYMSELGDQTSPKTNQ